MPNLSEHHTFPYSSQQLFDLVADVERYPEFLPWCVAARITQRAEHFFIADLAVRFQHITESYTSRVSLAPPQASDGPAFIDVVQVKGPFHHLENHWRFESVSGNAGQCSVSFSLDFAFRSRLLDGLIGGVFARANHKMIEAFSARAAQLYGQPK